jgi:fatty-acyl-CoA synthase
MELAAIGDYWARWTPDAVAIRAGERPVTWAEQAARTDRLAAGLQARGIGAGDRIAILSDNSIEWCELVLAAFRLGAVVVPLNVRQAADELSYAIAHSGARIVANDVTYADRFTAVAADHPGVLRLSLDGRAPGQLTFAELAASTAPRTPVPLGPADPAIIGYTSGTTGRPKGAILTHGNLLANFTQWQAAEGWRQDTVLLACIPLSFTGGIVSNFLACHAAGGTLVLEPRFDAVRALELIRTAGITVLAVVPAMWEAMAAAPGFADADLSSITSAITGGAPCPPRLFAAYDAKGVLIRQTYALTEACASVVILPRALAATHPEAAGLPSVHTEVRIVDEDDRDLPAGATGQILVRGPQVMAGYWDDPDASARALAGGWLHTGDLGRLDADGLLHVVDRQHDTFISGGLNVYPAEIERALTSLDGLTEVAAYGVPHDRWGETVAVTVWGENLDADRIVTHCRGRLGDYKIPRYVTVTDEPLPRSMSGKILRRELRRTFDADVAVRTSAT